MRRPSMRSEPQTCWCFDRGLSASRTMRNTFLLLMSHPSWYFVIAAQMGWGTMAELMAHNLITVLNHLLISLAFLVFSCLASPNTTVDACQLSIFSSASTHTKQPEKVHSWGCLSPVYHQSPVSAWFFMLPGNPARLLSICFLSHHPSTHCNLSLPLFSANDCDSSFAEKI